MVQLCLKNRNKDGIIGIVIVLLVGIGIPMLTEPMTLLYIGCLLNYTYKKEDEHDGKQRLFN